MALGQWRLISSGQSTQVRIPSGNYLWPTIRVMNPNDGVLYVKENAPIVDTNYGGWDYKVPAQSFGILPSEGEGWQSAGMYYSDQSGTNRPGEVAMYLSSQKVNEPTFVAIGRSLVTQSSSVDIASGNQPANPGAGFGRLWIDTSGHLNVLQPSGTNFNVVDSNNFSTYIAGTPVGGDVHGTVPAIILDKASAPTGGTFAVTGNISATINITASQDVQVGRYLSSTGNVSILCGSGNSVVMQQQGGANANLSCATILAAGNIVLNDSGGMLQFGLSTVAGALNNYINFGGNDTLANGQNSILNFRRNYDNVAVFTMTGIGDFYAARNIRGSGYIMSDIAQFQFGTSGSYYTSLSSNVLRFVNLNINCDGYFNSTTDLIANQAVRGRGGIFYLGSSDQMYIEAYNGAAGSSMLMNIPSGGIYYFQIVGSPGTNAFTIQSNGDIYSSGRYFPSGQGSYYWQYASGSYMQTNAHVLSGGGFFYSGNTAIGSTWNGTGIQYTHNIYPANQAGASIGANAGNLALFGPATQVLTSSAAYTTIYAAAFSVQSTRKTKDGILTLEDPLAIVLNPTLHGISYLDITQETPQSRIGFIADDWEPIVPEVCSYINGELEGMIYPDITAILFEALKNYVIQTNARLDALETR